MEPGGSTSSHSGRALDTCDVDVFLQGKASQQNPNGKAGEGAREGQRPLKIHLSRRDVEEWHRHDKENGAQEPVPPQSTLCLVKRLICHAPQWLYRQRAAETKRWQAIIPEDTQAEALPQPQVQQ